MSADETAGLAAFSLEVGDADFADDDSGAEGHEAFLQAQPKKKARTTEDPNEMVILVRAPYCKELELIVAKNDIIDNVKAKIQDVLDIPISKQRLISATKTLEDCRKISDYNIEAGDLLIVMPLIMKLPSRTSSSRCAADPPLSVKEMC